MGRRRYIGKIKKSTKAQDQRFGFWRHPLADVDPKVIKSAIISAANKSVEDFPNLLASIINLFKHKYPPQILSTLSGHGLFAGVRVDGVSDHGMIEGLQQHHIEFLQALALTIKQNEWGQGLAHSQDIQFVIDKVIDLAEAFHQKRLTILEYERDAQQRVALGLQERIRLHTQAVRNWGYYSHVTQISLELYSSLDEKFSKNLGFSASDFIKVGRCMVALFQRRISDRFGRLSVVFQERQISRFVKKYYEVFAHIEGSPEEFFKSLPNDITLAEVKSIVLSHSDLMLSDLSTFKPEEIAAESGLTQAVVIKILEILSAKPEMLSDTNVEHIFLDNPVWKLPIIALNDEFFCPIPQSIFSHIHHIMRTLAISADAKELLEKRRGEFLEKKVDSLLRKALPRAHILKGVKWQLNGTEYETDHIVKIDRIIMIVEDKSGAVSGPGLRGASERMKHHIHDLIVESSEQSLRLETLIWQAKSGDSKAQSILSNIGMNFDDVAEVIRISVTLDDFSVLASAEGALKEAEWISSSTDLSTTLNIADFQCIAEILDKQSFFVHYFVERQRFQKAVDVVADELDWLGFYLQTGMNIWGIEGQNKTLGLTGMSRVIDRYYSSIEAGLTYQKPAPKILELFAQIIDVIEERAFPGWLEVSTALLRCGNYAEQKRVNKMLMQLKSKVSKKWRDPSHECSVIVTPTPNRNISVVFYVFPEKLSSRRKETADQLGGKALNLSGRSRCIVIGKCIEHWEKPYSFIYSFSAGQADAPTGSFLTNGAGGRT